MPLSYRVTPFANGASDNPDGILKRIGEGNLKMDSGNWLSVSFEAKVRENKVLLQQNHE